MIIDALINVVIILLEVPMGVAGAVLIDLVQYALLSV